MGLFGCAAAALAGCAAAPSGGDLAGVNAALAGLIAADNAGDVEAIASFYAPDAALLPPTGPPVQGRAEIRRRYEAGFERFALEVALETAETQAADGWAFSRGVTKGRYLWRDGSQPTALEDKYLMILKRDARGAWKVAALMWSPVASEPP